MLIVGRDGGARDQRFSEGKSAGHGFKPVSTKKWAAKLCMGPE